VIRVPLNRLKREWRSALVRISGDFAIVDLERLGEPPTMPLQQIPDDFDPEEEKRRLRQGGCCGPPGEG
jgi:hypothetical protein